jgi:hypothetical protein
MSHIPLAVKIAAKISPQRPDDGGHQIAIRLNDGSRVYLDAASDPLVSVALETMLRVWPAFDRARGVPFGAFCRPAVTGAVVDEAARQRCIVRGGAFAVSMNEPRGHDEDGLPLTVGDLLTVHGTAGPSTAHAIANLVEDAAIDRLDRARPPADLDPLEREIWHCQKLGWTNAQIAAEVGLNIRTLGRRLFAMRIKCPKSAGASDLFV